MRKCPDWGRVRRLWLLFGWPLHSQTCASVSAASLPVGSMPSCASVAAAKEVQSEQH